MIKVESNGRWDKKNEHFEKKTNPAQHAEGASADKYVSVNMKKTIALHSTDDFF